VCVVRQLVFCVRMLCDILVYVCVSVWVVGGVCVGLCYVTTGCLFVFVFTCMLCDCCCVCVLCDSWGFVCVCDCL
jgi:hypothetical protein